MSYKLIKNDFQKSTVVTLTTVFFVAAGAMLVSLAMILIINLTGSIDSLMTKAQISPPTDSPKNAVDMFPRTDRSKVIHTSISRLAERGTAGFEISYEESIYRIYYGI